MRRSPRTAPRRSGRSPVPTCGGSAAATRPEGIAPEALLGEVRSLFEFACARDGDAMAVRAFNPTREEHGYEPVGSVLETNTDDLPFLVDSVSGELASRGLVGPAAAAPDRRHRARGQRRASAPSATRAAPSHRESVMHFDLDRRLGDDELAELEDAVRATLTNVRAVVRDFPAMLERTNAMTKLARAGAARYEPDEVEEVVDFLAWLQRGNFVYLGAREYDFSQEGISLVPGSGLGILADEEKSAFSKPGGVSFDELPSYIRRSALDGDLLLVDKANAPAPVHRRERMDYIGVRRVDEQRRDHRHVARDRPVHDQGLRRARLRDAAARPQAAPVPRGPRADRGLARLQGRRRAVRHLPEGRAVRRPGRRPARRRQVAARARGHPAGAPARPPRRRRAQRVADPHAPARPLRRRAGGARARPVPAPLRHHEGRDAPRARRQRALARALPRPRARRAARAGAARARGRGHRALAHVGRRAARPAGRPATGPSPAGGWRRRGWIASRATTRATPRSTRPRTTSPASAGWRAARATSSRCSRSASRAGCASTRRARRSSSPRRCRCSRTSGCACSRSSPPA